MALLSFRGIITPSLPAQGEQRRSSYFNIRRGNSRQDDKAVRESDVSLGTDEFVLLRPRVVLAQGGVRHG